MRMLHCSDFHANKAWFDWLVAHASEYDLVCLTGDMLDLVEIHRLTAQLRMVKAALRRVATPLALCSGNHDSLSGPRARASLLHAAWLNELRRPGLWIDGDAFEFKKYKFRCIGWDAQLPIAAAGEIWLFHAPPARSPVASGLDESEAGDEVFDNICRAGKGPEVVLSGHQHNPRRWICRVGRTWCLNPGYSHHANTPNHIAIDTVAGIAALHTGGQVRSSIRIA